MYRFSLLLFVYTSLSNSHTTHRNLSRWQRFLCCGSLPSEAPVISPVVPIFLPQIPTIRLTDRCFICLEDGPDGVLVPCGHRGCYMCLQTLDWRCNMGLDSYPLRCPICRDIPARFIQLNPTPTVMVPVEPIRSETEAKLHVPYENTSKRSILPSSEISSLSSPISKLRDHSFSESGSLTPLRGYAGTISDSVSATG
jgi:hypothetical protein